MLMFATLSCDPALGQSTVVPAGQDAVQITVLVESSRSFSNQPWEAIVWHNCQDEEQWQELKLSPIEASEEPVSPPNPPGYMLSSSKASHCQQGAATGISPVLYGLPAATRDREKLS